MVTDVDPSRDSRLSLRDEASDEGGVSVPLAMLIGGRMLIFSSLATNGDGEYSSMGVRGAELRDGTALWSRLLTSARSCLLIDPS